MLCLPGACAEFGEVRSVFSCQGKKVIKGNRVEASAMLYLVLYLDPEQSDWHLVKISAVPVSFFKNNNLIIII